MVETNSDLNTALREKAVQVAKEHKSSWIELGQYLGVIYKDKLFKEWGFLGFEGYCMKELGIKQTVASKLIKSYHFLEEEEPRLVKDPKGGIENPRDIPNYESVNLLRQAKHHEDIKPQDYAGLRHAVIEGGKEPKDVRAQMKQIVEHNNPKDPNEVRQTRRAQMLKRLATLLSNARQELQGAKMLPANILDQMEQLAKQIKDQIE